jgi:hypothetical protein
MFEFGSYRSYHLTMQARSDTDVREWAYSVVKGRIATQVARGNDNPSAVIKYSRTMAAKYRLQPEDLERIFDEVDRETVQPFFRPEGWYRPERVGRLLRVRSGILA